jgi:hypothetical protein
VSQRLLAQHRVFCEHPVEIGSEPIGQVIGLDWAAEPPRVKATGNSVANLDPRHLVANGGDLARAIGGPSDRGS